MFSNALLAYTNLCRIDKHFHRCFTDLICSFVLLYILANRFPWFYPKPAVLVTHLLPTCFLRLVHLTKTCFTDHSSTSHWPKSQFAWQAAHCKSHKSCGCWTLPSDEKRIDWPLWPIEEIKVPPLWWSNSQHPFQYQFWRPHTLKKGFPKQNLSYLNACLTYSMMLQVFFWLSFHM